MEGNQKGWHSVKDGMPKIGEYVVCYAPTFMKPVFAAKVSFESFYHLECHVYVKDDVTHWMHLPDAPENSTEK